MFFDRDRCGIIDFRYQERHSNVPVSPLNLKDCQEANEVGYICERRVGSGRHVDVLPVIVGNDESNTSLFSVCPSGHVTHDFLSCDIRSKCFSRPTLSDSLCDSPLLPSPPMFACSNDIEQVPYPLVCDHRSDCRDHSDEIFCTFPSCVGSSFQCETKHVNLFFCMSSTLIYAMIL